MKQLHERAENISRVFSPDHRRVAQEILALLPEQGQGWRLASEPPDNDRDVLTLHENGKRLVNNYRRAGTGHEWSWSLSLTHWRELPPPPSPATAETATETLPEGEAFNWGRGGIDGILAAATKAPPIETKAGEGFKADDMQPMSLANSYMKGRADAVNDTLEMEQAIQAKDAEIARLAGEVERLQDQLGYAHTVYAVHGCAGEGACHVCRTFQDKNNTPPAPGEKQDPRMIAPNGRRMVRYSPSALFPERGDVWGKDNQGVWWHWCAMEQRWFVNGGDADGLEAREHVTFDGQPLPQAVGRGVTVEQMLRIFDGHTSPLANKVREVLKT